MGVHFLIHLPSVPLNEYFVYVVNDTSNVNRFPGAMEFAFRLYNGAIQVCEWDV